MIYEIVLSFVLKVPIDRLYWIQIVHFFLNQIYYYYFFFWGGGDGDSKLLSGIEI